MKKIIVLIAVLSIVGFSGGCTSEKKTKTVQDEPVKLSEYLKKEKIKVPKTPTHKRNVAVQTKENSNSGGVYSGLPVGSYQGHPRLGKQNAPNLIEVFWDYECPYCQKFFKTTIMVMLKNKSKAKLIVYQLPLKFHKGAKEKAKVALCAHKYNQFWPASVVLFSWGRRMKIDYSAIAKKIKIEEGKLKNCVQSAWVKKQLQQDDQERRKRSVTGTPTVYVNGNRLSNWTKLEKHIK
ncbi:MAG: thioredoxin domain-containing protein [Deltaproteobacteria bacterium]|nr:thioredoxin domain-containing protein [Deltaproteobacteria bacterium]